MHLIVARKSSRAEECKVGSSAQTNSCWIPVMKGDMDRGREPFTASTRSTRDNNEATGTLS